MVRYRAVGERSMQPVCAWPTCARIEPTTPTGAAAAAGLEIGVARRRMHPGTRRASPRSSPDPPSSSQAHRHRTRSMERRHAPAQHLLLNEALTRVQPRARKAPLNQHSGDEAKQQQCKAYNGHQRRRVHHVQRSSAVFQLQLLALSTATASVGCIIKPKTRSALIYLAKGTS